MNVPPCVVRMAERQARLSNHRVRVGAVIYKGKRIHAYGFNYLNKTHPDSTTPEGKQHAEFVALVKLGGWLIEFVKAVAFGYDIYVHRLKRDGTPGLAKPCEHCAKMLAAAGIRRINYSV